MVRAIVKPVKSRLITPSRSHLCALPLQREQKHNSSCKSVQCSAESRSHLAPLGFARILITQIVELILISFSVIFHLCNEMVIYTSKESSQLDYVGFELS